MVSRNSNCMGDFLELKVGYRKLDVVYFKLCSPKHAILKT
jgi:hypothetical protein